VVVVLDSHVKLQAVVQAQADYYRVQYPQLALARLTLL
jgi:hypothetical protein